MKPSNKEFLLRAVAILLFLCVFGTFFVRFIPSPTGEGMTYDATTIYAKIIETEMVTNWHSSLFMYEGIVLKWVLRHFVGVSVSGVNVLYAFFWLFSILICSSMVILLLRLLSESRMWILFIPAFSALSCYGMRHIAIGLDYYFLSFLWCEIIVILLHYHTKVEWKKTVYACLMLLVLFHLVSYRRNAILYVPVVMGYLMWTSSYVSHFLKWHKILIWGVSVVLFSLLSIKFVDYVLPVYEKHPLIPMMESDVRIASILRGEESVLWQMNLVGQKGRADAEGVMCAYWVGMRPGVEWDYFKDVYIEEWRKNYDTMVAACIIQRVHFYLGDYGRSWIRSVIENRYPAVKNNNKAWNNLFPGMWGKRFIANRIVLALTPLVVWMACMLRRRKLVTSYAGLFVIVSGLLSIIYASSFCIVTPTPNARYLTPSIMLSLLSMFVLLVAMGIEMTKRCIYRERSRMEDGNM